jgi:hypothetical protein
LVVSHRRPLRCVIAPIRRGRLESNVHEVFLGVFAATLLREASGGAGVGAGVDDLATVSRATLFIVVNSAAQGAPGSQGVLTALGLAAVEEPFNVVIDHGVEGFGLAVLGDFVAALEKEDGNDGIRS